MKPEIDWLEIVQLEPYHFKVRSTNRRKYYDVILRKDETMSCTCKGFKYNGVSCRHIVGVKAMVE